MLQSLYVERSRPVIEVRKNHLSAQSLSLVIYINPMYLLTYVTKL